MQYFKNNQGIRDSISNSLEQYIMTAYFELQSCDFVSTVPVVYHERVQIFICLSLISLMAINAVKYDSNAS